MRAPSSQHAAGTKIQQSKRELRATTKYIAISHCTFLSQNQNKNLFYSIMLPTLLNDASPSMSPTFLNDVSPSDEEQEHGLFTQPEAEAIGLTVELDPPKRKATTQGKNPNKKKQHCDISDADLDAQLKQVSAINANDSLLCAATKDNETKKVTKYFTMPVLGKKSSIWWESFAQFIPSKHPKLFTEYVMCLSHFKVD
jgi:hypothetical protein